MTNEPHARLLLADDEPLFLHATAKLLRRAGFDCRTATDAPSALEQMAQHPFDLLIADLNMPGNLELELLNIGRRDYPQIPIIVVTGAPSLRSAIDSVRLQIADYLLKPIQFDDLVNSVRRILASARSNTKPSIPAERTNSSPDQTLDEPSPIGNSAGFREVMDLVGRAASTDACVLITGESGTGKELVAQALHQASRRASSPFVTVDCTAIPEALFESVLFGHSKGAFTGALSDQPGLLKRAHGGTVFFDEIGELPLPTQSKLLRQIQHSTFTPVGQPTPASINVRYVAATNRDLQAEVRQERFRQDLFYRLSVIPILVPPLRERGTDIIELARHFLQLFQPQKSSAPIEFSAEALQCLQRYSWPGNIRELKNIVERAVTLATGPQIETRDLPTEVVRISREPAPGIASDSMGASRTGALIEADRGYLTDLLRKSGGNVTQAAAAAGVTRQGMYKLLQKHGITPAEFR